MDPLLNITTLEGYHSLTYCARCKNENCGKAARQNKDDVIVVVVVVVVVVVDDDDDNNDDVDNDDDDDDDDDDCLVVPFLIKETPLFCYQYLI